MMILLHLRNYLFGLVLLLNFRQKREEKREEKRKLYYCYNSMSSRSSRSSISRSNISSSRNTISKIFGKTPKKITINPLEIINEESSEVPELPVVKKYKTVKDCGKDVVDDKLLFCVLNRYAPETIELKPAFDIDEDLNLTYNLDLLEGINNLNSLMSTAGADVDDNINIYTIPILLVCTTNKKENHSTILILYNRKIYSFGLSNYMLETKYYCRIVLPDGNLKIHKENTVKIIVPFFDCISSTYLTYITKHFLRNQFIPSDPREPAISIPLNVEYHRYNSMFNPVSWRTQNCSTFATIGIPTSTSRFGTFSRPESIKSYLCIFDISEWTEILKSNSIPFIELKVMNEKLLFYKSVGLGIKNKTKKMKRRNTIKLEKERRLRRRRRQKSQKNKKELVN